MTRRFCPSSSRQTPMFDVARRGRTLRFTSNPLHLTWQGASPCCVEKTHRTGASNDTHTRTRPAPPTQLSMRVHIPVTGMDKIGWAWIGMDRMGWGMDYDGMGIELEWDGQWIG